MFPTKLDKKAFYSLLNKLDKSLNLLVFTVKERESPEKFSFHC